jgi:hypothetical protein
MAARPEMEAPARIKRTSLKRFVLASCVAGHQYLDAYDGDIAVEVSTGEYPESLHPDPPCGLTAITGSTTFWCERMKFLARDPRGRQGGNCHLVY